MTAKVLFVDDDEANLVVCEAACGEEFPVLLASSAAQALECMKKEEVGVIVADQRMPGTTGVELLERVREEYPDTVRMLLTAFSDIQAAIQAINRGRVRRYLRKTWEPGELKAEIADVGRRRGYYYDTGEDALIMEATLVGEPPRLPDASGEPTGRGRR